MSSPSANHPPTAQRKIKILQLLERFDRAGGLEQVVGEIACGLDPTRFEVEIWCIDRAGELVEEYRRRGIVVRVLNISTYHNPLNILKLAWLFREVKPDIIHSHIYYAAVIGRVAGFLAGVPAIIHHVHSTYWHFSRLNVWLERILSTVTYRIICVSKVVQDFVCNHERIADKKTRVIYNGISKKPVIRMRHAVRTSLGLADEDVVITTVASLLDNKGHAILLQALALILEKKPGCTVRCLIVGDGPRREALQTEAKRLGLKDVVRFLGVRADVPEILNISDIFVLASIEREGLPVSILEALAYGVPVVASRVGGIPEIIRDGDEGCLIAPKDAPALAEVLHDLAGNAQKRVRIKNAGSIRFENDFQAKRMIEQIEECYLQGLNERKGLA